MHTIEWWMVDGLIGLVVAIAAIKGAAKGIGDTVLRIVGFFVGLAVSVMYSNKVADYLAGTRLNDTLYSHIFKIVRRQAEEQAAEQAEATSGEIVGNMLSGGGSADPYSDSMPKSLSSVVSDLADKTAEAAADRLTEIALGILAFALVMLACWLIFTIIRLIYKALRKNTVVIGFLDRVLGFVLGVIRGAFIAFVVVAALVPLTTLIAPDKVPDMITAIHNSQIAGVIYDVNPILLLIKHLVLKI